MFFDATIGKKNHTIFKIHVSNIFPTDWAENSRSARVVSKTKHSKTKTEARSTQISKTKHPKLENGVPKTRKRSTQDSKTKHPNLETTVRWRTRWCDPYLRQGSLRVATPSPRQKKNHINSLKYFSVFLLNCKIRHASTTWKELIRKSLCLPIFRNITEITKKRRVYLGDAVTKLQTFVWIFKHVSRVTTWSLFNLKSTKLVQITNLNMTFYMVVSVYRQFKSDTRPSALRNSEMANSQGDGNAFATPRSSTWIVLNCIPFVIVLDSCCWWLDKGLSRVFKGQTGFEFWVLRFRFLGASFSRFGCSVFEIWVLRASVFVFECFVFETTDQPLRTPWATTGWEWSEMTKLYCKITIYEQSRR